VTASLALQACTGSPDPEETEETPPRTIRATVQADIAIHPVPVGLGRLDAAEASAILDDDDLVLGVVAGGERIAFPVRFLAMSEVVDDTVGDTPVAASW